LVVNDFTKVIGGVLFVKIPIGENIIYIMFVRNELIHSIYWAGNPNKQVEYINGKVIINPRSSFESYKEEVCGSSKPFSSIDFESLNFVSKEILNSWKNFESLKEMREIKEEQKFIEEQKLHSMIELINNISHQWRQPLSIISTISSGIIFQKELDILNTDKLVNDMNTVIKQSQYLSKTIDYFKDFLQATVIHSDFSVVGVIRKSLAFIEPLLKDITIITNFEKDIILTGYENEFIQSVINIINNAKDAVSNKEEKLIFINTNIKNEKFVIEILDSGEGISTEIINRIFEPYFTTKHQSIGTGLGLSFTYNILKRYHNASFKVENKNFNFKEKEYLGASFTIYLPVNK
jgi:light-regulated signal transduction histidine kinase (bacteriophytochrome)